MQFEITLGFGHFLRCQVGFPQNLPVQKGISAAALCSAAQCPTLAPTVMDFISIVVAAVIILLCLLHARIVKSLITCRPIHRNQ